MVKKMYLKDTKREKEREREIDFGIIFNLALITFYALLSRARARGFSFSSFSLQTLITGSRVEFIHSRASFGSPFCYIDFRRLRFYALFFSVFLRIRTYRVLVYKI